AGGVVAGVGIVASRPAAVRLVGAGVAGSLGSGGRVSDEIAGVGLDALDRSAVGLVIARRASRLLDCANDCNEMARVRRNASPARIGVEVARLADGVGE